MLVLHPSHKLKYFSKQGWNQEWIDTAEEITRDEFIRNYAAYVVPKNRKSQSSVPTKKVSPSPYSVNKCYLQCDYFYQQKVNSDDSSDKDIQIVDSDSSTDEEDFITELDNYLKSPRVKNIKDPLNWWYENRGLYPRLSRMARDFLMIPGKFYFYFYKV